MDKFLEKFLIMRPFLKMISDGKFFTKIFSWFLMILACLVLIGFLYSSYKLWYALSFGFDINRFFSNIFGEIILIALAVIIMNILLIRAADIAALPRSKDYIIIPSFVIFLKMIGEITGVFYALMGVAAGIAIWIAGAVPLSVPGFRLFFSGGGFAGGLTAVIAGPLLGFLLLCLFYFIAEQVGVLMDIARNTKR